MLNMTVVRNSTHLFLCLVLIFQRHIGLPLGWDGKPIPYWLYKLHGLNVKYNCEICGDQKYQGSKAFTKHFQEWKHAAGMRALGIPNTVFTP